jgi:hypothetical protein
MAESISLSMKDWDAKGNTVVAVLAIRLCISSREWAFVR